MAGGLDEDVPLGSRERDVGALGRVGAALRGGGAEHDLDVRVAPGDPRGGDRDRGHHILRGEPVELRVQLGVVERVEETRRRGSPSETETTPAA